MFVSLQKSLAPTEVYNAFVLLDSNTQVNQVWVLASAAGGSHGALRVSLRDEFNTQIGQTSEIFGSSQTRVLMLNTVIPQNTFPPVIRVTVENTSSTGNASIAGLNFL